MAAKIVSEVARGDGRGDNREKRAQLDDAVAPGELLLWENLRQQTVFRWSEQRRLAN